MKKKEICHHCNADYIPTKKGVQKFCSKSCKSRFWYLKNLHDEKEESVKDKRNVVEKEVKADKMSWAGVGNATAGTLAAQGLKSFLTPLEKKPATKKDIQELKTIINGGRYLPIENISNDVLGRKAYYDVETGNVVYLNH